MEIPGLSFLAYADTCTHAHKHRLRSSTQELRLHVLLQWNTGWEICSGVPDVGISLLQAALMLTLSCQTDSSPLMVSFWSRLSTEFSVLGPFVGCWTVAEWVLRLYGVLGVHTPAGSICAKNTKLLKSFPNYRMIFWKWFYVTFYLLGTEGEYHSICVEIKGQLLGACSLFLLCRSQQLDSG